MAVFAHFPYSYLLNQQSEQCKSSYLQILAFSKYKPNPSNQSKTQFNLYQFIQPSQMQAYTNLKDKGNNLFKQKKFKESIDSFHAAIDLLLQSHPKQSLDNSTEIGKLYVILNINAAFAALNLKTKEYYQKAEVYCSDALSIDPKNQKGLFRRGLANKEFAQLLEVESNGAAKELLTLNEKAKRDFEDVVILDRTNDLAQKKLTEVIKNLYRITVSQGKEANFSSKEEEKKERSSVNTKVQEKKEEIKVVKKSGDMNKILKEYRVDEVTELARAKVQQQYLTHELPRTRAELEKGLREIGKSEDVLLQFIYRMSDDYLKKIQPTFDMLFQISGIVIKKGEGEKAKEALLVIKNQKAFDLLWKSYSGGEKKQFIQKWTSLGLSEQAIK